MDNSIDIANIFPFATIPDRELQHIVLQLPLPHHTTLPVISSLSLDFTSDLFHCFSVSPPSPCPAANHSSCSYSTTEKITRWPSLVNLFTIININIRSLKANFRKLALLLSHFEQQPDIIVLTETWLKSTTPLCPFYIKNYNIISSPRPTPKRGGGVAIYIKTSIQYTVITNPIPNHPNLCEISSVEIHSSNSKNIINACCKPPGSNNNEFITYLTSYIKDFCNSQTNSDFLLEILI